MASTSCFKKPCYDVFINHRGVDVKLTLASAIYQMLDFMGVQAFLDREELELGDFFPQTIQDAIHSASLHIAIFSPRYAESPWCLEELLWMLQTNVTIIPVFYRVEPSDLRYVDHGMYAGAFNQHRDKGRYSSEKIGKWKEALDSASNLNGRILDGGHNCDEGKLLREIVDAALHNIKKLPLEVATFPVGLDQAVLDFESKVGSSIGSEDVHIVGIVGMGGSGKTTLAKELYNRKRSSLGGSSFLPNVRDAASTKTMHKLQEKLLKDLRIQHSEFDNKDEGMGVVGRGLRSMSVLIVLDDVDHVDQIEALFPHKMMHNLGRGSFIIITTREKVVLKSCGISSIYHMKLLDSFNARRLFCRHAFLQPYSQSRFAHPDENSHNFKNLIERFVKACNGLPLSLKVVGAMVNGQSQDYWEDQLLQLSRILPEEIAKRLKLSYDALDSDTRQMFLDVACFFIGGKKSLVVPIWYGSGWTGEIGWETLFNKCLVGIDEHGNIDMHDHLRDLGRRIARDVSPHRLWKEDQISSIQEQINFQGGRTVIRGIVLGLSWRYHGDSSPPPLAHFMEKISTQSLGELQLLAVKGNDFREQFAALSRDLVWLRWHEFNGTNLPSWLSLANLRVLELYNPIKLEELWQDNVQPPLQLRELIIDGTENTCLRRLPRSIGCVRHLKKIVLNGNGSGMRSLPEEFCHLKSLEFLELRGFPLLSALPDNFGKLINLRSLQLETKQLNALPDSFKQLTALQSLSINSESFMLTSEMLDVLEFMTQLQVLSFEGCSQLKKLPHLTTQVSLRELHLRKSGLRKLPNKIGQLTKLETLKIGGNNLTRLPESLGALSCLTNLQIKGHNLTRLPESLGALSYMTDLQIEGHNLISLPKSLGALSCLTSLKIGGDKLTSLPESLGALSCLTSLNINGNNLTSLPESLGALSCLTGLEIWGRNLTSLPESLGALSCLTSLKIGGDCLTSLPESLGALPCLTYLKIGGDCLTSLPESIGALSCLTSLHIQGGILTSLPESLGALSCLTSLHIKGGILTNLPESLGALSCLIDLGIEAHNLTSLPESLGALHCLTYLKIENCKMLESLPGALGRLSNLQSLHIWRTPVLVEIDSGIESPWGCNLKSLKSLYLVGTRVCRISISDGCCPGLETLFLWNNNNLTEIETLPGNVREITVEGCKNLKNMRGIRSLLNLERLVIRNCRVLEVLPYPPYMHSVGHTISIRGCPMAGIDDDDDDDRLPVVTNDDDRLPVVTKGCFGCF